MALEYNRNFRLVSFFSHNLKIGKALNGHLFFTQFLLPSKTSLINKSAFVWILLENGSYVVQSILSPLLENIHCENYIIRIYIFQI